MIFPKTIFVLQKISQKAISFRGLRGNEGTIIGLKKQKHCGKGSEQGK